MNHPSLRFRATAASLALAALALTLTAAPPDFSTLDQKPAATKAPPPVTGIVTRGQTRGVPQPAASAPATTTRGYNPTRGKVTIVETDGTTRELPYVVLPILFRVNSDELLDDRSRQNLALLAAKLKEPQLADARFVVEGHTSTEGGERENLVLSERRAERIVGLLVGEHQICEARLARKGYGEQFPEVRELTKQDQQQNRRVLVVREK